MLLLLPSVAFVIGAAAAVAAGRRPGPVVSKNCNVF